jgi:addiction module HigA family antidote
MISNPMPLHPGTVLAAVYLSQMNMSQSALASKCGCAPRKINEIVNGKRSITPEFALVLETVLGTSAEMWVRMQADYDLWVVRQNVA